MSIEELYPNCICRKMEENGVVAYTNNQEVSRKQNAKKCKRDLITEIKMFVDPQSHKRNSNCEFPINWRTENIHQVGFVDCLLKVHQNRNNRIVFFVCLIELKKSVTSKSGNLEQIRLKFENTIQALKNDLINIQDINIVCVVYYKHDKSYAKYRSHKRLKNKISIDGKEETIFYVRSPNPICVLPMFQ